MRLILALMVLVFSQLEANVPVVCSVSPVYQITKQLLKDVDEPALLVDASVSPHGFSLKPSDIKKINDAKLVIWIGEGYETYLAKPLKGREKSLELMTVDGLEFLPLPSEKCTGCSAGNHHDHDALDQDPHIWLSVERVKKMATAIHQRLVDFYDQIEGYRITRNYINLIKELDDLSVRLRKKRNKVEPHPVAVFHNAYQYLFADLNLEQPVPLTYNPEAGVKISKLSQILEEEKITCVFTEVQFPDKIFDRIQQMKAVTVKTIDPLGAKDQTIVQTIEGLADTIMSCFAQK